MPQAPTNTPIPPSSPGNDTRFAGAIPALYDEFEKDLRVTIQALGWRSGDRYLPLQDDIASVVYWYQREPHAPFPKLPPKDALEIQ